MSLNCAETFVHHNATALSHGALSLTESHYKHNYQNQHRSWDIRPTPSHQTLKAKHPDVRH